MFLAERAERRQAGQPVVRDLVPAPVASALTHDAGERAVLAEVPLDVLRALYRNESERVAELMHHDRAKAFARILSPHGFEKLVDRHDAPVPLRTGPEDEVRVSEVDALTNNEDIVMTSLIILPGLLHEGSQDRGRVELVREVALTPSFLDQPVDAVVCDEFSPPSVVRMSPGAEITDRHLSSDAAEAQNGLNGLFCDAKPPLGNARFAGENDRNEWEMSAHQTPPLLVIAV